MRNLAVVVAAALVFALIAPAFAQPFADVPTNHWAYDAIAELAAKGLIEGYPDGTFKGDRAMTRYEMAMVVARLLARIESIQIPAPTKPGVTKADLDAIQRLVNEFRAELAALGVRVTAIEEELNAIKAKLDNVRITGAFRFRYDDNRTATNPPGQATVTGSSPGTNGNPNTGANDASLSRQVPRAREILKLVFDGSVAPDVHLIAAFLTGGGIGGQTYQIFNSSNFGNGGNGSLGQYMFGSVDNLFFDWKDAFGWPLELWLGRFGGSGVGFGTHPVQFGPFGLLLNTGGDTWEDSTADSGANVVDGFAFFTNWASMADLHIQGLIARVTGNVGGSTYAWGEDAWGLDANIAIWSGLRVGAYYVTNNITNPAGFAGPAPAGPLWHLYGPGGGATNPSTTNCPTVAGAGIQCAAAGSGGGGYLQWDIVPGIHFDGEYAQWNDSVHATSDTGYQVNVTWDLATLTGIGHNFSLQTGYLNYGVNFYPPYGAAEADIAMADNLYPGNAQGFTAAISFDPVQGWTIYGLGVFGNHISNGQNIAEWEAGVVYKFAPSAKITFKVRDERINNIEQFLLYRAQVDYSF
mgnify:CR=1 FL=1